jgi:hypothetical protein
MATRRKLPSPPPSDDEDERSEVPKPLPEAAPAFWSNPWNSALMNTSKTTYKDYYCNVHTGMHVSRFQLDWQAKLAESGSGIDSAKLHAILTHLTDDLDDNFLMFNEAEAKITLVDDDE